MAFLESAAVARGIRTPGEPQIDSNRELLATGAANIAGSFFTALPAAGGFSQSAVNLSAGARSQLSTLVTVAFAVLVALFLGPVLSLMPEATLAAIVFVAVVGLIDVPALRAARAGQSTGLLDRRSRRPSSASPPACSRPSPSASSSRCCWCSGS